MCGRGGMSTVFTLQFGYTPLGASCSITCNYTAIAMHCTRSNARAPVQALQCRCSIARSLVHAIQCTARTTLHALQCTRSYTAITMGVYLRYFNHNEISLCSACIVAQLQCNFAASSYGSLPKLYCNHNEISLCNACIVAQVQCNY